MTSQLFSKILPHTGSVTLSRDQWKQYAQTHPGFLADDELIACRGYNEPLDHREIADIYLPLMELLYFTYNMKTQLHRPYIIAVSGSVAVGKSTLARVLQYLLMRHWKGEKQVDLVTTDGFLYDNATLYAKNNMHRKGFPDSYDLASLIDFMTALSAGHADLSVPVYSHHRYDIVPGAYQVVNQPDILILEGLNILQTSSEGCKKRIFVSNFLDFSIYLDADMSYINQWYINRFLNFRQDALHDETAFFHRFALLDQVEAHCLAQYIWETINEKNLKENILPYHKHAHLILYKDVQHAIKQITLNIASMD